MPTTTRTERNNGIPFEMLMAVGEGAALAGRQAANGPAIARPVERDQHRNRQSSARTPDGAASRAAGSPFEYRGTTERPRINDRPAAAPGSVPRLPTGPAAAGASGPEQQPADSRRRAGRQARRVPHRRRSGHQQEGKRRPWPQPVSAGHAWADGLFPADAFRRANGPAGSATTT